MPGATWRQVVDNVNKKGDVLAVARLAGMMAAEQAGSLVPAGQPAGHQLKVQSTMLTPARRGGPPGI